MTYITNLTILYHLHKKYQLIGPWSFKQSLQLRHNGHDGVSNHLPYDCLLNRYSGADQRKHQSSASLAFVRGIHRTGEFPTQRASNAENVFTWWRHHMKCDLTDDKSLPEPILTYHQWGPLWCTTWQFHCIIHKKSVSVLWLKTTIFMITSSNGNILRVTGRVTGIHQWPVNSPHKGQWRRALMCSFIGAWINDWVNNREDGDLRLHHAHYDVIVMWNCSHIPGANECEQGRHTSPIDMPQQARWCLKAAAVVPRVLEHCP